MGDLAWRLRVVLRHDLGHRCRGRARLAGFAGAVSKESVDPALGEVPLPAPHRRATVPGAPGPPPALAVALMHDDPGALHMLERPAAVADDRGKSRAVLRGDDHGNGLYHEQRLARFGFAVNLISASVH